MTGSQKPSLLKRVYETLAGRVVGIEMFPLSGAAKQNDPYRKSYYPSFSGEIKSPWSYQESIENIIQGGYPNLVTIKKEHYQDWFKSYLFMYVLGDIKFDYKDIDELTFIKFLKILATRTGESLNYSILSKEVCLSIY